MTSREESVTFELPYQLPDFEDADNDVLDYRLGLLMPYNSSGSEQGVNCKLLRIDFESDNFGLETTWELYKELTTPERWSPMGAIWKQFSLSFRLLFKNSEELFILCL